MAAGARLDLRDLPPAELAGWIEAQGEPAYRGRQLMRWLYRGLARSFESMLDLPKALRERLGRLASAEGLSAPRILESARGDAVKFVFGLKGFESVLLLDGGRRTACLSSQLGCGLGCRICATGAMGYRRDLTQAEVLGQLIEMDRFLLGRGDKRVDHVVFMGMGEALANRRAFAGACAVIMHPDGFGLSGRRVTVSTAGVVPHIERLAAEGPAVNLAVSLNAATDALRDRLMPINRRYPLARVVEAAAAFERASGRALTFEYVVIRGENDGKDSTEALARLLKGVRCKVNCIPLNDGHYVRGRAPAFDEVRGFAEGLRRRGLLATVRRGRGGDIGGACGQLGGAGGRSGGASARRPSWGRPRGPAVRGRGRPA